MASKDVIMPVVESGMEKGYIVRWLKAAGEAVQAGEPLLEVESDKAIVAVEAPVAGLLARIDYGDDTEVPVGTVIAAIDTR